MGTVTHLRAETTHTSPRPAGPRPYDAWLPRGTHEPRTVGASAISEGCNLCDDLRDNVWMWSGTESSVLRSTAQAATGGLNWLTSRSGSQVWLRKQCEQLGWRRASWSVVGEWMDGRRSANLRFTLPLPQSNVTVLRATISPRCLRWRRAVFRRIVLRDTTSTTDPRSGCRPRAGIRAEAAYGGTEGRSSHGACTMFCAFVSRLNILLYRCTEWRDDRTSRAQCVSIVIIPVATPLPDRRAPCSVRFLDNFSAGKSL